MNQQDCGCHVVMFHFLLLVMSLQSFLSSCGSIADDDKTRLLRQGRLHEDQQAVLYSMFKTKQNFSDYCE